MQKLKRYAVIFFIVPWTFVIGCATLGINKSKTPAQNARIAVADIASGLSSADKTAQALYIQQQITAEEVKRAEQFIRQGTVVNDQLNACVDQMKSAVPGTAEAVTAATCVSSVLSTFKTQSAQVVAGIKSPQAQAAFNASLELFDSGIAILEQAITVLAPVKQ